MVRRPNARVIRAILCLAFALGFAACGGRDAPPSAAGGSAPPSQSARAAPQPSGPQWPRAAAIDTSARAALPPAAVGRLQESPVPVLVPNDSQILQRSEAVVVADQYTLTSKLDTATVSIQASPAPAADAGRAERSAAMPRTQIGSRAVFFTENEAIRVATWIENGVSYSAEVECAKADDPKCRDNTYLRSIVEKLVFVGGKGARLP